MGHDDVLKRRLVKAAIAALAVVILAAGLCLFDHDRGGLDDHSILPDLCLVALLVPAVLLLLTGLLPTDGLVVSLGSPACTTVSLSVPDPVPRCVRLASLPSA